MLKRSLRLPAQKSFGFGVIAYQGVNLERADLMRVFKDFNPPRNVLRSLLNQLPDGVTFSGGKHEVFV